MRSIDIVAHCWRYSRMLCYMLTSLCRNPAPSASVRLVVFCNVHDAPTVEVLKFFRQLKYEPTPSVMVRPWNLPLPQLLRRAIGRNYAAICTQADLVWFADVDYVFGENCLETLATIDLPDDKLFYPRVTLFHEDKSLGDAAALRAAAGPGLYDIDPSEFEPKKHRAIGGAQIVRGETAREYGYCAGSDRHLRPVTDGKWRDTKGDIRFRRELGTKGTPIDLPNLYRIRQTEEGRVDTL